MDGIKLLLEKAGDEFIQNDYYNGWVCDHYTSAVLVFCPDGTIPICCYNVPGSVHDSKIAVWGGIYDKLVSVYEANGGKCCVDSAFAKNMHPCLVKSGKDKVHDDRNTRLLKAEATSFRQSAEWGMRCCQSSSPRMKDRYNFERCSERRLVRKMLILPFNFRARTVGINQIRNIYMSWLTQTANHIYLE